MRILAIERELASPLPAVPPDTLRAEAAGVWDLLKRGVIRDIWSTSPGCHAVILLESPNLADARKQLAALTQSRSGLIDFTLHELHPYDGLERLFASNPPTLRPKPEEPPDY